MVLPILNIIKYNNNYNKNWTAYSIISMSLSAIALAFQILYSNHMVKIEDWSALMDTSSTSVLLSIILLIATIILNTTSLNLYGKKA